MRRILFWMLISLSPSLATAAPFVLSCTASAKTVLTAGYQLPVLVFRIDIENNKVAAIDGFNPTGPLKVSEINDAQIIAVTPKGRRELIFGRFTGHLKLSDTGKHTQEYSCKVAKRKF